MRHTISEEQIRGAVQIPFEKTSGDVSLVPFPPASIPDAWRWLNEFPKSTLDDYGPKTEKEFAVDLLRRVKSGQIVLGAKHQGVCVGIIGFQQVTPRMGHFAGICFSKEVHGKGVARAALSLLMNTLWAAGLEKIEAVHFADNQRIFRLLCKLGGFSEGLLLKHALRDGRAIDCRVVGFLRPEAV